MKKKNVDLSKLKPFLPFLSFKLMEIIIVIFGIISIFNIMSDVMQPSSSFELKILGTIMTFGFIGVLLLFMILVEVWFTNVYYVINNSEVKKDEKIYDDSRSKDSSY